MFRRAHNHRRRVDAARAFGERVGSLRRVARLVLQVIASVALAGGLVFGGREAWRWATTSPTFGLRALRVLGAARATEDELVRLGGLALGQNLLLLDCDSVEREIRRHPWVKTVAVTRKLPAGLEVRVVEYQPVALAALGDQLYLVDTDATPFKRVQTGDGIDLPLITGVAREAISSARQESLEALRLGLRALDAYLASETGRAHPVSEVHLEAGAVSLVGDDGSQVLLGEVPAEDAAARAQLDAQLRRLARVRRELVVRGLSAAVIRLDNRVRPSWITVSPRGTVQPEGEAGRKAVLASKSGAGRWGGGGHPQDQGTSGTSGTSAGASERKPRSEQ
jgi:cell division protein FtsQ